MKKWIIIALIASLAGVLLMGIGVLFQAKTTMYIDANGIHTAGAADNMPIVEKNLEDVTSIDIDVMSGNIEIAIGDSFGIEIINRHAPQVIYSLHDGRLSVRQPEVSPLSFLSGFSFNLNFQDNSVKVTVPREAVLAGVSVSTASGNVSLAGLQCGKVEVEAISGRVVIADITAGTLTAEATSGKISIERVTADHMNLSNISGGIAASDIETKGIEAEVVSGGMEIRGKMLGKCEFDNISGKIELFFEGQAAEYSCVAETLSGGISINGRKNDFSVFSPSAANSIRAEAISGNISIAFEERSVIDG